MEKAKEDARKQGANLDHDGEEMDDWIDTLSVRRATADLMEAARQDRWTIGQKTARRGLWHAGGIPGAAGHRGASFLARRSCAT